MRFKKYLNEFSTAKATNMEMSIVQAWNHDTLSYPDQQKQALETVNFLKKQRVNGKAKHLGSGSYPLSKIWIKYGGTNSTPKTDLIIGKYKISLKKEGPSQLMSGKKGESKATFFSTLQNNDEITKDVLKESEIFLNKFIEKGISKLNITGIKASSQDIPEKKIVKDAEKLHKQFTVYLKNVFNNYEFIRNAIVAEAMTGDIKFNKGDGSASHLLIFGENNKFHDTHNKNYVSDISSKAKINVSFKSTSSTTKAKGKMYTFFSVVRLLNNHITKETKNYEGILLTEGIIKNIINNIKTWFNKIIGNIKKWWKESIENIFIFFEIEPKLTISNVSF